MLIGSFLKCLLILHYNRQPIPQLIELGRLPLDNPLHLRHCCYYNPIIIAINPHWANLKRCKNRNPFPLQDLFLNDYYRSYQYLKSSQNQKNLTLPIHQNCSQDQYRATLLITFQIIFSVSYQKAIQC